MTSPSPSSSPASFPAPPDEPEDYLCCHRHCSPCIKDYYRAALAKWKVAVQELGGDPEAVLKALGRAG